MFNICIVSIGGFDCCSKVMENLPSIIDDHFSQYLGCDLPCISIEPGYYSSCASVSEEFLDDLDVEDYVREKIEYMSCEELIDIIEPRYRSSDDLIGLYDDKSLVRLTHPSLDEISLSLYWNSLYKNLTLPGQYDMLIIFDTLNDSGKDYNYCINNLITKYGMNTSTYLFTDNENVIENFIDKYPNVEVSKID